ncbi:MAG: proline racemase [Osedax symbiont Rs2]|nr:MAG: proline racemase [Osedax symbiont Rs2]
MSQQICSAFNHWQAPDNFLKITTLDCHTGGEPLRIITAGFPELLGDTVLQRRRYCLEHFDHLRTAVMFEPRGHADMYGVLVTPPERVNSHFGAIFIHNEGYSTMCGHAIIALSKFAVESGMVERTGNVTEVRIDAPCGLITAWAKSDAKGQVTETTFDCVPSFVAQQDAFVDVPGFGKIRFDLAYGGAFYAYVNAGDVGLSCEAKDYNELIRIGRLIKQSVNQHFEISHPYEQDLGFLYGTIFVEELDDSELHSRNVCVFAEGEVDRSPTGSGVSGRAAIHYGRGDIAINQPINISSILDSRFVVEVQREQQYGPYQAIIPRVTGSAHISGKSEFIIDPSDPLKDGFILR